MVILLDLDGTLLDTANSKFKPIKDGLEKIDLTSIPLINGAREFINSLKTLGHLPIILSDSHPKYVDPIATEIFDIPALSLCDKPNIKKASDYLIQKGYDISDKSKFIVIGDTWLDIELARALNFISILTNFYIPEEVDSRDGIGKAWHQLKSGPTFVVKEFNRILEIIQNPITNLWSAEAIFQEQNTSNAIRVNYSKLNNQLTIFRSLGRQEVGECDNYGLAVHYNEFQRKGRSLNTLTKLASAVNNFVDHVILSAPHLSWDLLTYVTDKSSTNPPNKMGIFFDMIKATVPKAQLLQWSESVDGSIRNRKNYAERREFIRQYLSLNSEINIDGKSIIVIDDQFTTGATAYEITDMLRQKGAKNILFLTIFFMTSYVSSNRNCSKCGQSMQLKIRKSDGVKFFSCVPPQFKGKGCGHIENIEQ